MSTRRSDDPRDFHGPDFRAEEPTFRLGYKEASVSVKGISVFIALAVLAIVLAIFYSGYLTKEAVLGQNKAVGEALASVQSTTATEHKSLRTAQNRISCILTMNQEDRIRFRNRYQQGAFKQECPWLDE